VLCQWIKQHWKPKGDVKIHLGAKGFFTVVFTNLEDRNRVFDGGPYFFALAGLYMRPLKARKGNLYIGSCVDPFILPSNILFGIRDA